MANRKITQLLAGPWPIVVLVICLLVMLKLMGDATQNSTRFGELYSVLFVLNVLGLATLGALILWNFVKLLGQVRNRQAGARLTVRMVAMFVILAVTPVTAVYYFSLQFLHRGIDSWFDVRIENALNDALELSRTSLGVRMRELLKQTELLAADLGTVGETNASAILEDARLVNGASELTLMAEKGRIIATSSETTAIVPSSSPDDAIMMQVRQLQSYIGLDPIGNEGLYIRVVVPVASPVTEETRILQALFPITDRMNVLAQSVERAFVEHRELVYLRKPLKLSFTLTLSLVLLLSLFSAIWAAFFSARRMVAPLRYLVQGTQAVAEGDFDTQLPQSGDDELGFVVASFNKMTRQLASANDANRESQAQLEAQRTYLETVLSRLSSGVITLDTNARLITSNTAAAQILGVSLNDDINESLALIASKHENLRPLIECINENLALGQTEWDQQLELETASERQVLMCRGSALPTSENSGHVIVFDDITTLIQAQREAAWSEVARRLAHEIKNPLTPIQLSAERLRHKYMHQLDTEDSNLFDRLTRTIVQQVEGMKQMVNAFSDYAKNPQLHAERLNLNGLVRDVAELYRANHPIITDLAEDLTHVLADPDRLRQVLHNLIKNALEANEDPEAEITVRTRVDHDVSPPRAILTVSDNGTGLPGNMTSSVFEPYVTTKTKGTGLGLAIVKRIIEEHGGSVRIENNPERGVTVSVNLPIESPPTLGRTILNQRQAG